MTTAESLLRELIEACEDEDQSNCTEELRVSSKKRRAVCEAARSWLTSKDVADAGIGRPMRNGSPE